MSTIDFEQAERNARLRDIEKGKVLTEEELRLANELQAKANEKGMKLVPERKIKNKARFVQIIQQNIAYLRTEKYLTNAEKSFLMDISGFVGFLSNCLVQDISSKNPVPLTQSDLSRELGIDKSNMRKRINSLIDKGILARSESGIDNNNVRAYALFVNPNIMFSGSKDEVNLTLKAMFKKVPKELQRLPVKLF